MTIRREVQLLQQQAPQRRQWLDEENRVEPHERAQQMEKPNAQ
jgi:hypothetical protein